MEEKVGKTSRSFGKEGEICFPCTADGMVGTKGVVITAIADIQVYGADILNKTLRAVVAPSAALHFISAETRTSVGQAFLQVAVPAGLLVHCTENRFGGQECSVW